MMNAENAALDELTLRGGWRLLCVSILCACVRSLCEERRLSKSKNSYWIKARAAEGRLNKSSAEAWIEGGVGMVTFEDACDVMEIRPAVAREKIIQFAHANRRRAVCELFS